MNHPRNAGALFGVNMPGFALPGMVAQGVAVPSSVQPGAPMAVPVVLPVTSPVVGTQVYPAPPIESIVCPVCPSLPSSDTAYAALQGKPSAFLYVLRDLVGRSALIGLGLYAAGERDGKKLAKYAVAGGVSIELCVFGYVWATTRRK